MYWQYVIVSLIGLITLGIVVSKLYRLFIPSKKTKSGGCDGCTACSSIKPRP